MCGCNKNRSRNLVQPRMKKVERIRPAKPPLGPVVKNKKKK